MTLRIPITITMMLASLAAWAIDDPVDPFKVMARQSQLAFKTDREFVGGTVKLFSAGGQLLSIEKLKKRKVRIDFSTARFGQYKVEVSNGNKRQEIYYMKK